MCAEASGRETATSSALGAKRPAAARGPRSLPAGLGSELSAVARPLGALGLGRERTDAARVAHAAPPSRPATASSYKHSTGRQGFRPTSTGAPAPASASRGPQDRVGPPGHQATEGPTTRARPVTGYRASLSTVDRSGLAPRAVLLRTIAASFATRRHSASPGGWSFGPLRAREAPSGRLCFAVDSAEEAAGAPRWWIPTLSQTTVPGLALVLSKQRTWLWWPPLVNGRSALGPGPLGAWAHSTLPLGTCSARGIIVCAPSARRYGVSPPGYSTLADRFSWRALAGPVPGLSRLPGGVERWPLRFRTTFACRSRRGFPPSARRCCALAPRATAPRRPLQPACGRRARSRVAPPHWPSDKGRPRRARGLPHRVAPPAVPRPAHLAAPRWFGG